MKVTIDCVPCNTQHVFEVTSAFCDLRQGGIFPYLTVTELEDLLLHSELEGS